MVHGPPLSSPRIWFEFRVEPYPPLADGPRLATSPERELSVDPRSASSMRAPSTTFENDDDEDGRHRSRSRSRSTSTAYGTGGATGRLPPSGRGLFRTETPLAESGTLHGGEDDVVGVPGQEQHEGRAEEEQGEEVDDLERFRMRSQSVLSVANIDGVDEMGQDDD